MTVDYSTVTPADGTGIGSADRRRLEADGLASWPLIGVGCLVALLLIAFANGYGYHRDELYFLAAGEHLAWGYPDQGPLTPLIAHAMNAIAPGSLVVLRIPSALMAGCTASLAGLICFELEGSRRAQLIAASCAAVASVLLIVGHLLSTTTFDLLAWSAVTWLVARAIRTGEARLWAPAGAIVGLALLDKPLIAFLIVALGVGLLLVGPRDALRSGWLWAGLAIGLLLWSPWLLWQSAHGWPQLTVSSNISQGGSTSSQSRWALLPFQFLLVSPVLSPIWIAGLWALARKPRFRRFRLFAVAWLVLLVVFFAADGKPYYLAGMFPVLLAAGAIETDAWLQRGSPAFRRRLLVAAISLSALVSAVIALPLLPANQAEPVIAMNADVGETIGWPQFTWTVAGVYREAGRAAVIFTSNYGEAGAIDRFGPELGLPSAYSGHNGFAEWGPPPNGSDSVVVVGLTAQGLREHFKRCRLAARVHNSADVDNEERGTPIDLCASTRGSWSSIWGRLRHLN